MNHNTSFNLGPVLEENNAAASLIKDGNYLDAITLLKTALTSARGMMKMSLHMERLNGHHTTIVPRHCRVTVDICMIESHKGDDSLGMEDMETEELGGEDDHPCVYQKPVCLPNSLAQEEIPDSDSIELACLVVIFNLALSHHLLAMRNQNEEDFESRLRSAMRLYEVAFTLGLRGGGGEGKGQDNSEEKDHSPRIFFFMATVNNLGVAYEALDDAKSSGTYFQHLLSTLMCLVEEGGNIPQKYYGDFFRNTSRLVLKRSAASAA